MLLSAALGLHYSQQGGRKAWEQRRHESFKVVIQMQADCTGAIALLSCCFMLRQSTLLHQPDGPQPQLPAASMSSMDALFRYCSADQ